MIYGQTKEMASCLAAACFLIITGCQAPAPKTTQTLNAEPSAAENTAIVAPSPAPVLLAPPQPTATDLDYTVKSGDSLARIARNTTGSSTNWPAIADRNLLEAPYDLKPGEQLIVPFELLLPSLTEKVVIQPVATTAAASTQPTPATDTSTVDTAAIFEPTVVQPGVPEQDPTVVDALLIETTEYAPETNAVVPAVASAVDTTPTTVPATIPAVAELDTPPPVELEPDLPILQADAGTQVEAAATPLVEDPEDLPVPVEISAALDEPTIMEPVALPVTEDPIPAAVIATNDAPVSESITEPAAQTAPNTVGDLGWLVLKGSYYPREIKAEPDAGSDILLLAWPGTRFQYTEHTDGWYAVNTDKGQGYIRPNDAQIE